MKRNSRFWLLLSAALIVVVLIVGGSGGTGPPYDPRSVAPDGARGIVDTLERLGASVEINEPVPADDATAALMLQDRLTLEDRQRLRDWIRSGGVLVVADAGSEFAAPTVGVTQRTIGERSRLDQEVCTIDALAETTELVVNGSLVDAFGRSSCFGDGNRAFVVAEDLGSGTVVTIGSPDVFTNEILDDADAAVLAITLLAPQGGDANVTFIGPSLVDFGEEGLTDLVPPRVTNAIMQLLAAFLLYGLYRGRRLGGVVPEPVPVRIEGSELVLKAGVLSERAKDPQSAAQVVQEDVRQRASKAFAHPTLTDEDIVARTGLPLEQIAGALSSPVPTDADLARMTQELAHIEHRLYDDHESDPDD